MSFEHLNFFQIAAANFLRNSELNTFALADFVDDLARMSGNNRARHAAAVLRAETMGRPPKDDDEALLEVERIMQRGTVTTAHACSIAARRMPPEAASPTSVARRLQRKYDKKK